MLGASPHYASSSNSTRVYSPVTLSSEWPTLGRLLFIVACSCLGSTINGFFVAAFFVERTLNRVGNVFLACVGLSELIVTTAVMPVSAVVLLSGEWDLLPVCHALQFLTESSTYSYSLFFTLVAVETYYRLCRSTAENQMFVALKIALISITVFIISFVTAGLGVYLRMDYDYCQRKHFGNFYFRSATSVIFHAVPFLVIVFCLLAASVRIRHRAREQVHYKRSQQYVRDYSMTNLNLIAYLIYVVAWTPYLVIVHEYPKTTDNKFYHCVWIGISRSIFSSLLYSTFNRNFRRAFAHLFYYCCCKSTLTDSFNSRHRRALEYKSATGDVRVHIMHQAMCVNSPHRAALAIRETQEL